MNLEIKIKKGLSALPFNCSTEPVRTLYGEPEETEELDNQCDGSVESIVWNYPEQGLIFFFDTANAEPNLCTIESDNIETELLGKKIFQLNQSDIIALMKGNGFAEMEEEDETWGEHRVTFEDAQIDFYFSDGELNLVSWSSYSS